MAETGRWNRTLAAVLIGLALVAPFILYPVFLMEALCFALFACAFNLLIGYVGLLSFGLRPAMLRDPHELARCRLVRLWRRPLQASCLPPCVRLVRPGLRAQIADLAACLADRRAMDDVGRGRADALGRRARNGARSGR